MNACNADELKEVNSVKLANQLIEQGWSVMGVFLRSNVIVYVLGKFVRSIGKPNPKFAKSNLRKSNISRKRKY